MLFPASKSMTFRAKPNNVEPVGPVASFVVVAVQLVLRRLFFALATRRWLDDLSVFDRMVHRPSCHFYIPRWVASYC